MRLTIQLRSTRITHCHIPQSRLLARSIIIKSAMDGWSCDFRVTTAQHSAKLIIAVLQGDLQEAVCSLSSVLSSLIFAGWKIQASSSFSNDYHRCSPVLANTEGHKDILREAAGQFPQSLLFLASLLCTEHNWARCLFKDLLKFLHFLPVLHIIADVNAVREVDGQPLTFLCRKKQFTVSSVTTCFIALMTLYLYYFSPAAFLPAFNLVLVYSPHVLSHIFGS